MKIGILGTGVVGSALGKGFAALGHEVKMGSRSASNKKALAWAKEVGPKASVGTFRDAAAFGEVIALCTLGAGTEEAVRLADPANLVGKAVIDATNPLDMSGMPPKLFVGHTDSLGERVQRLAPGAHVVKAFNTVGNAQFFRPEFSDGPPDMFICGDDEGAKEQVSAILQDFGWGVIDVGGILASRYLEPMCIVWVAACARSGNWNAAFKLLRK